MTALIVIGVIALFIFILLASSVTVDMEYDRVFKYRVKYLFFTIISAPESERQKKKRQRRELKEKKTQKMSRGKKGAHPKQQPDKEPQKNEISELKKESAAKREKAKPEQKKQQDKPPEKPKIKFSFDLIKRIIGRASPHIKRIFKKIRLSHIIIDITAGGDDAAKAAISYGVHCAAVHGLICFLDSVIRINVERINIVTDFRLPKNEYYAKGTVKLRLSTLLHSGIWGFFAVLSELRKDSGAAPEKTAPKQKKAA